jgi:hypothetical protein
VGVLPSKKVISERRLLDLHPAKISDDRQDKSINDGFCVAGQIKQRFHRRKRYTTASSAPLVPEKAADEHDRSDRRRWHEQLPSRSAAVDARKQQT